MACQRLGKTILVITAACACGVAWCADARGRWPEMGWTSHSTSRSSCNLLRILIGLHHYEITAVPHITWVKQARAAPRPSGNPRRTKAKRNRGGTDSAGLYFLNLQCRKQHYHSAHCRKLRGSVRQSVPRGSVRQSVPRQSDRKTVSPVAVAAPKPTPGQFSGLAVTITARQHASNPQQPKEHSYSRS